MGQTHRLLRIGLTYASNVGDVLHEIPHLYPRYHACLPSLRRHDRSPRKRGEQTGGYTSSHKLREMFDLHALGHSLSDLLQLGDVLHRIQLLHMFRRDPRQAQILQPFERQLCVVSH
jgi:hypothetical protein